LRLAIGCMADVAWAAFSFGNAALFNGPGATRMAFEILLMAQMIRRPVQALTRRWYCRSLFRASRGRFHCAGCTGS
jgi:hypothetical protein